MLARPHSIALGPLLAALSCGNASGPRVIVTVYCIPAGTTSLRAELSLDSGPVHIQTWMRGEGLESMESFEIVMPRGGALLVEVSAQAVSGSRLVTVPEGDQTIEVDVGLGASCSVDADASPCGTPPGGCGPPFSCGGSGCYTVCNTPTTWEGARQTCLGWSSGACLAIAEDPEIAACLAAQSPVSTWIALRQDASANQPELDWTWNCTGTAPATTRWDDTEPDDGSPGENHEQDCAVLQPTGLWQDFNCTVATPAFFCQR